MADQIVSIGFHIDDTEVKAFQSSLASIGSSAAKLDDSQTDVKSSASNLLTEFVPSDGSDPAALFSNLPTRMASSYRSMFSAAQREAAKLNELLKPLSGDKLSVDMAASVRQSLGFLTANIRTLVSSAQQIGGVFSGISDGMKGDFAAAIGDMMKNASMVQRADKWMAKSTSGLSDRGFAAMLQADAPFAAGLQAVAKQFQLSPRDTANLLEGIVKHSVPALRRATYFEDAQEASGGHIKRMSVIPEITDFRERLPARYHNLPVDPRDANSLSAMPKQSYPGRLSQEEYDLVKRVAATNPTFEQALIATGLAKRGIGKNQAAVLKMPRKPISREGYASALGYMYRDMLIPALEGAPAYYRSISSADGFDQTRIANKSSRVPREVYQAAAMLDTIDVSPTFRTVLPTSSRKMKSIPGASSVAIRPDSYQVASLTLDDFRAGRVLDASAGYKFGFDEDRHDDGSIYKIINRSGYTDLLGMHGNNTFGDGRGGNAKSPRMMLINVGDRLLAKDSAGNLVFTDDGPARDDDTRRALTAMFERRADLPYRHAGVDSVYKYPVVEYGDGARYVPTNVKGTNIVLSREDVYRKASLPFLQKYGVNVFDNLMDMDTEFSTVETMTKRTEARNRMMTPSVPMTELGGRMPSKNRIAFVDLSSVSGLDGAMMFMPGFIPGDNATIRAPGIKGQAQTVDFHKMIKDLYGQTTTSFYLPAMNAPKEAKDIFADPTKGIEYARKHYSPEQFSDYFLDVMQYDALVTDSVIKSDFYRDVKNPRTGVVQHKGNAELQRRLSDALHLLGDGSFRVYETADGFWSDGKVSLSAQMSQGLSLTEDDIKENDRLWNAYMQDLQDPAKVIGMLFSDQTDPVSKRVTSNPGQLWQDKEAQTRISQALSSARLARARGELFGRGNLAMGVALANPGEWIMAAAKGNRLSIANPELAEILSLTAANGTQGTIAAAKWSDTDYIGAGRYPNNTMEAFSLANSMAYIDLLKKYGMSTSGIYMNMDTIKRMGGGDFDGDTVQLVRKRLQETIARTFTERKQQLGGYAPNKDALRVETETLDKPRTQQAGDMADMLYRNAVSTFKMSQVSTASDALSQGNWNDPNWVKRYGRAGLDLRAMYDIDSTFAKTGVAAKWTQYAQNARYGLGKPFAHAFKGLAGAIDNGRLDQITDLSTVNLPSIYNALTVSSLAALGDAPVVDSLITQLVDMQSAKQGIHAMLASPDKRLQARGRYLQKNLSVMSDLLTGRAQGVSASDQDEQESYLAIWAKEADVTPTTKVRDEDSPERREEIRAIKQQYARLDFARDFGLTERNIASNAGYANVGMFKNARMSGQHSTFQRVANEEAARLQTQAAIIAGTEFTTVSALQAAELSKRVNEGIRRYNGESIGPGKDQRGFQYSVSMLKSLENKPEEWYRQRVKGIRPRETIDAALGTATHAAMEAYLKRRMANDSDYGTAAEFEKLFEESLVKSGLFGDDLATLTAHGPGFTNKVGNARAFVRSQPTLFRDEVILGSETVVRPLFGYQIDPVTGQQTTKPLPSLGKIDVVSRKKLQDGTLGPVMFTELKPTKDDAGALRQMRLYGEARGDEQNPHPGRPGMLRVIGYNDPIDETQSGAMSAREVPYDQAAAEADVAHFQKLAKGIQTFALAGLPEQEIDKYLGQYQVQRDARTHSIVQDQLNPRRAEVFGERTPLPGPTVEETRSHQQQQSALEIDENTGKGIARGIALQEEQFSYGDELSKLRGTFISKERAAENGKLSVSQWDRYAHMLDETNGTYYWKRKELKDKGASETDLALLDQERKETYDAYQRALRSSSYADLEAFTKATNDARSSMNVSSNVGSLIKQFTDLEDAIVRASSAYGTLQADLQQKASVGEKITEEDTKALERAQAAMVDAQNAKSTYQAALQAQAKDKAQGLVNQAILPFATEEERNRIGQAQHLAQLNQAFSTAEATISDLESKGLISSEDASAMRQRMSAVTPAQRDALAAGAAYASQRERANAESREQLASIDRARYLRESYRQFADELSPQQQQLAERERIERENPYWQKATVQRHKERSDMLKLIKQFDDQDAQLTEQLNDPNITKEHRSAQERQRRINQRRRGEIEQKYQAKSSSAGFADDISQLHNVFANMGGISQGDQLINQYEQMQEAQVVAQNKLNEMKARLRDLQQKNPKKLSNGERNEQKALTEAIPTAEASLQGIGDLLAAQQPLQQERGAQLNNRHLDDVLANGVRRSPDEIAKRALQDRAHALRSELSKLQAKDAKGYTHYKNLTEEQRKERIDAYNAAASNDAQNKYGGDIYALEASRDASTQAHLDYSQASLARRARSLHNATYGTGRGLWGRAMSLYDANLDRYQSESVRLQDAMTKELERQQKLDPNSAAYAKSKDYYNQLNKQKQDVDQQAKHLEGPAGKLLAVSQTVSTSISRVFSRFSYRFFMTIINEIKTFVKQFDAAMTTIQMITGKTDGEIDKLGKSLIQTALDMKVSVADVTSAAADLYRQGISDEEVSVRMEDVLKFAKVAGIKAEEASKIITTALSNNLVSSSSEAMDALVALGDSAATTASEIAKGMQKSAASAKQAGVSYEELVTMLTIITSKTQLGGNQAGTALQTLMYRLYRVGAGEDYYDENGNRVASTDATKALKQLGVDVYDDNGNQRGVYDIMIDIARNWESADTISQEMVLNALGAGRQRSNIATLIQGLAEDDGALADKYMKLASGSAGVTDEKYLAYLDSLEAAQTTVKNSFDSLIASQMSDDGFISFLNNVANTLQWLAEASNGFLSLTTIIQTLIGAMLALSAASAIVKMSVGGAVGVVEGIIQLLGVIGITVGGLILENAAPSRSDSSAVLSNVGSDQQQRTAAAERIQDLIDRTKELAETDNRTAQDEQELQENLAQLNNALGISVQAIEDSATGQDDFSVAVKQAQEAQNSMTMGQIQTAVQATFSVVSDIVSRHTTDKTEASRVLDLQRVGIADTDSEEGQFVLRYLYDNWYAFSPDAPSIPESADAFIERIRTYKEAADAQGDIDAINEYNEFAQPTGDPSVDAMAGFINGIQTLWAHSTRNSVDMDNDEMYAWAEYIPNLYNRLVEDNAAQIADIDEVNTSGIQQAFLQQTDPFLQQLIPDAKLRQQLSQAFVNSLISQGFLDAAPDAQEALFYNEYFSLFGSLNAFSSRDEAQPKYETYVHDYGNVWEIIDDSGNIVLLSDGTVAQGLTKAEVNRIVADHNTQPVTQEDRRAALVASGWYDLNPTPSVVRRPEEDIYAEWDASSPTLNLWDYVDDVGYLDYDGELLNIFSADQIIDALAMGQWNYRDYLPKSEVEGFPLWNLEDKEEFLGQVRNYIGGYIDSFGYPEYAPHYAWEAIEAIWDDAPPEEFPTVIDQMNLDAGGYGFIRGIIASAGSYLTPPKTPFEDYLREARDAEDIAYQEQLTVWQTSEAAAQQDVDVTPANDLSWQPRIMPGVTEGTSSGDDESGFGRNIRTAYNGYLAGDSVAKSVVASGFIEYLLSPDENNAVPTDIEGVIRRLEASEYPGLMNVLTSIPEVAAIMNRVLIPEGEDYRRDENGRYVVADGYVGNSALGQFAFNDLLATLGEAAPLYSSIVSNNRYTEAMYASAMRGRVESGATLSEDEAKALSSIVGEGLSGKLVRAGAQFYDIDTGAWSSGTTKTVDGGGIVFNPTKNDDGNGNISWDISNLPEDVQTWIREKQKNGETINYETLSVNDYIGWARRKNESIGRTALSDIEGDYYDTLINNAAYGISGLTTRQKIAGANTILGHIAQGTVGNLLLSTESDVIDAYMSAYENMPAYVSMAQIVEGTGHNIRELEDPQQDPEDYEEINAALLQFGYSATEAKQVMRDLDQEVFIGGVTALNLYGDATERVTSLMQQWAGTTEDVANAMRDLVSQMTQLSQNEYWRNRYNSEISSGTLSIETVQAVAQMLGVNEDFVIANEAAVTAMLGLTGQGDKETLGTLMRGMDVYLNDAAVQDALVETEEGSGVYNLTSSVAALEALTGNANAQMLLQLLPLLELFTGGNVLIKTETRQVAVSQTVAEPEQPQSGTSGVGDGTQAVGEGTQEPVVVSGAQSSGGTAVVTGEAVETAYEERTYYTFQTPQTITPYAPMFYDTELNNVLQSNYGFGVESLSPQTRLALGLQMRQIVSGGNIGAFMANSGTNTRQTYANLYTNAAEYMHLAKLVDDMEGDYDLEQLTEGSGDIYDDIDEHLRSMGYSAGYALQVIEDLDKEMLVGGLRAADAYGDAMEDVAAIIDQQTGSIKDQNEAFSNFLNLMQSAQDVDLLWALYSAGSREAGVVSQLASSLGVSETVLYNGNATTGAAADAYNSYKATYQYNLGTYAGAYGSTIADALPDEFITFMREQKGVDLSSGVSFANLLEYVTEWNKDNADKAIDTSGDGWDALSAVANDGFTVTIKFEEQTTTVKIPVDAEVTTQTNDNNNGTTTDGDDVSTDTQPLTGTDTTQPAGENTAPVDQAAGAEVPAEPQYTVTTVTDLIPSVTITPAAADGAAAPASPNVFDTWFASGTSYADGVTSTALTPLRKLFGQRMILNQAQSDTDDTTDSLMTTFNAATPYVQKQMAALSENTAMYLYMASNGIDVNALATMTPNATGYEEMVTSLNNLGLAFPEAQRYAQDFIEETETGILSLIQVFGDLTGEILEGSKAWKGTDRERFSAAKEMNSSIVTYAEGNYYRGKYAEAVANGTLADLPDFVVDWVVNQTGYTKDQVRANRNNEVSNMLNMASLSESETAESQATELSQFLTENSTLLNVLLTAGAQDPNGKIVVTDALISQVTAAKGAGAAEWAMFLSQVQNHGGSVSMTPVTYQDTTGEEVVDKTVYQITVDGVTKEISADDYAYRVSKEDKYGFGITSADAPGNKLATARTIGAALQTPGGISTWMTGKDKDTIAGLTGVFESLPKLAHLGKLVTDGSGGKLTIFDIADPTKAAQVTEILKAAGYTARDAEEAIEAYNNELLYEGIRAADTYGDSTEDVIANMEQLAGSAEEAAEAFHDLFDAMYQLDDLDALIALWNAGSRSDFVVSGVAKAIGMDESHVRDPNNANVVTSRLTAERALLAADYSAEVSAYDQYLTPDVLRMLGVPAGGSVEFTSAQLQGRIHKLTSTNPIAADKLQGLAEMMQVSGDTLTITADTVSAPSTPIAVDGTVGNISANAGRFTVNKANPVASEADLWFAGLTDQVNGIQVTGLTNYQGYLGAGKLWNKTGSGGFRAFFDGANPEVKSAMLNMTENAGWYSYLSYGIESKGLKDNKGNLLSANSLLTLQEGTAEYTAMESAVADLGQTMAQAQEYVRNFHEETEHGILASNKVWGDFTDSVIEGSKAWKGTASEIVSAISDINNAVTNAAKNSHLRMLLGQSSPAVSAYQSVADQYGLDVDYVRRNASTTYVQRILQMAAQADADVVATNMDAMALAIGADNLLSMFGAPNLESGTTATLDIPTAQTALTANGSDQAAALAGYLHYIQDSNGTVSFEMVDIDDGNGGTIPALRFSVSGLQMSMSETDSWYEGITSDKYGFGIDGVTDARRVAVGYDLLGLMQTGGVTNWLDANRTSTIGGISSMIEGMPKLMQMEAVLESKGYNMNRLLNADVDSDEYKAMDELLRGAGYSAAAATQAFDDMNNTLLYDGLRATQAYGESTEEVIQYMQQLEDGASGAAQAFMELASSMDSVKNIQQLMSQYDSGSRNPEQISQIAQITGLPESVVWANPSLTKSHMSMQLASSEEELESQFAALDPLVNKLNLPHRDTPYTMAEVIAYAETGDGKGTLTVEELAKLKLASATATQWGYSPTYTTTITPTAAGLPTDEQPANRSRSWVANIWNGIVRGLTGRNNEVHTQETDGQPSAEQPSAGQPSTGQFDLGNAGSITWGEADTWFINAWSNANRLGLSDLTDTQKMEAAALLQSWAEQGSLSTNLDAIQLETTKNAFTNLTPNAAAFMYYGQIAEEAELVYGDIVNVDENSADYSSWITAYGGVAEFEAAKDAAEDYFEEVADGTARVEKRWGDMTDEVLETAKQWKGTNRDIAQSMVDMNSAMLKIANNQYYRQQYLSGDRSDETVDAITGMTGKNRQMVKDGDPAVISAMEVAAASDLEAVNVYADAIEHGLNELPEELRLSLPSIYAEGGDLSAVADAVQTYDANLAEMIRQFAANVDEYGFEAALEMLEGADGQVLFDMVVSGLGATGVKPSGGGGGGGKSAVDKLLEEQEREQKLWEHRRKMIQYEETRYQNAGELSNYAIMLGHEADEIQRQIGLREKQIEQLKDQMRKTEECSDDWYTLRDAIMSGEEALSELINDAEELDRTLEEVQQQILKLHTDLEGTVLEEIEARIQKEREMQDATVSMQETILEAIRERYRKEWELMQEDLNKKRKALEEEISLIDERLQRRKDAEDEAAKHEELAELRRQYAMISMDSSRTKDQKELAEKIRELEDELMWGEAEDEAEREKTELQEQVDAYNEYETEYQEWLDEFLEDANNFTEEVNTVLKMNQEEMLAWLSENVEAFSLSLKEAQDQMLRNWADTFKQMRGITDTYWTEIAEALSSKEGFLAYMMESDAYKNASEDEQKQMVYKWETMYDDWIAAKKIRDEAVNWDHVDDFEAGSPAQGDGKRYKHTYTIKGSDANGNPLIHEGEGVGDSPWSATGAAHIVAPQQAASRGFAPGYTIDFAPKPVQFMRGGYVDYTGLAMVHGSPSRPEAFLSAADTELVRTMLDTWHFVAGRPTIMNVDGALGHGGTANTFGDISITITEASFADDADYEEVAKRVGEAFTKELSKQGFRTATFNF